MKKIIAGMMGIGLMGTCWAGPVKLILDSDMITDYDDAGAFAIAHAMADAGECEILATLSCTRSNGSVAAMEIINGFYGRPEIPVGCSKGMGVAGAPKDHEKFLALQKKHPGAFKYASSDDAPDAVKVYRRVLAAQPDASVTICSIGFFTNLRQLLDSAADEFSPLGGRELVARKVKCWYAMACFYPYGHEYNSDGDAPSTRLAIVGWPTPIFFCDFQYGRHLYSGRMLVESPACTGPVKDVFAAALLPRDQVTPRSWDQIDGHPSWDEATVLFAIRGWEPSCNLERGIYEMTDDMGSCMWRHDPSAKGGRVYGKLPKETVAAVIDELMCRAPRGRPVTVSVDFEKPAGAVKPMHGVGQPPLIGMWDYSLFHYMKDAGIPFSRLHDVGGAYGGNNYVDIPNIFRNFDADENDPKSYDFAFTDHLLKAIVAEGVEPFFRLGVTIENRADIRPLNIYPPKDFTKWARVCEHVIRHYTEGWADGFNWKIRYWEIWNEPENHPEPRLNPMWQGTWEEYLDLYKVTSKHLKACFPHLKIGGYASCGLYAAANSPFFAAANSSPRMQHFVTCYTNFLDFVKREKCPFDFFSFHTYSDVKEARRQVDWTIDTLHAAGFADVETTLNEWLPRVSHESLGTASQASAVCAEMLTLQQSKLDSAMIYDAKCGTGSYSPLFNPMTYKPHKAYFAMKAFNELYRRKTSVVCGVDTDEVYAVAAGTSADGAIVIANPSDTSYPLALKAPELQVRSCRMTDDARTDEEVRLPETLPPRSFLLVFVSDE